jgi:exodeoxyribonuclease-1
MYGSDHGTTRLVVPVAAHPTNKNSIIVFDLAQDPALLLDLGTKTLLERLYTATDNLPKGVERPELKQLLINKCPVIAPTSTLTGDAAKRLRIDLVTGMRNRQTLLHSRKAIQQKIAKLFQPREFEPVTDPDLMIYAGGFFNDTDKALMNTIHDTDPQELGTQSWIFSDKRLPEMLFRYRARNYPETLGAEEQAQWLEHCHARLVGGEAGHYTFSEFNTEIEQLRAQMAVDDQRIKLLDEVAAFGAELESFVRGATE